MDKVDQKIFLNKLKLNKIFYEVGHNKILFGKAKNDFDNGIFKILLPFLSGIVLVLSGTYALSKGFLKTGILISGLGLIVYSFTSWKSTRKRKVGNKIYKVLSNNTITFVVNNEKIDVNKNNLINIISYQRETISEDFEGEIILVTDKEKLKFIELIGFGAKADIPWISKFLTRYLGVDENFIIQKTESNKPLINI